MIDIGLVCEIVRYPVKWMAGFALEGAVLLWKRINAMIAGRVYAVHEQTVPAHFAVD